MRIERKDEEKKIVVQGDFFKNLLSILDEMGMSEEDVQKVNVSLTDMKNFDAMNVVYEQQFQHHIQLGQQLV